MNMIEEYISAKTKLLNLKDRLSKVPNISPEYHAFEKIEAYLNDIEDNDSLCKIINSHLDNIELAIPKIITNQSNLFKYESILSAADGKQLLLRQ